MIVTWDTPPVPRMAGLTTHSARVRSSIIEVTGLVAAVSSCRLTNSISPMTLLWGARTGVIPSGSCSVRVVSFSLTIWRARKTSIPQSNSTKTKLHPCKEVERTRRTLVAPLTAVSIGKVTRRSTSSGAMPTASVMTTTWGAVRSGKTSMSVRLADHSPATIRRIAARRMKSLWSRLNFIILLSIT